VPLSLAWPGDLIDADAPEAPIAQFSGAPH